MSLIYVSYKTYSDLGGPRTLECRTVGEDGVIHVHHLPLSPHTWASDNVGYVFIGDHYYGAYDLTEEVCSAFCQD